MLRRLLRWLLAAAMIAVGVLHFVSPEPFVAIMPAYLPWHLELVLISGGFEILGGLGLLIPRTRSAAGWGLIALYLAVFPANIWMATHGVSLPGVEVSPALAWGRLPLQPLFMLWAWWVSRADQRPASAAAAARAPAAASPATADPD